MTRVLYVAAEAYPLVKTGGLGDVAGALPAALTRLGVDVRVMLPAYEGLLEKLERVTRGPVLQNLLPGYSARLMTAKMPGAEVPLWLLDCPPLFARGGNPYGNDRRDWSDNHLRFAMLARAGAIIATDRDASPWRPDVVNANDWHAGLLPYYLRRARSPVRSVFTIHNMAYQGLYHPRVLPNIAVGADAYTPERLEFWGKVNFLKAGLVYADRISTVSPTYAREICAPQEGKGLDGVIRARGDRVHGILNGIDDSVWDPRADEHIARTYDADDVALKAENKAALRNELGLPALDTAPVIAIVSRLVEQKGIDVVLSILPALFSTGAQLVVLGSGDRELEQRLVEAAKAAPDRMAVRIGYDEAFAHQVIAGADILLVPSRFEPCGLTQLYAQRYGTIPVVHNVGGLADTVTDEDDGFSFNALTPAHAVAALVRACALYRKRPRWRAMQRRAMQKKSGWDACARKYVELYDELVNAEGTYGTTIAASG